MSMGSRSTRKERRVAKETGSAEGIGREPRCADLGLVHRTFRLLRDGVYLCPRGMVVTGTLVCCVGHDFRGSYLDRAGQGVKLPCPSPRPHAPRPARDWPALEILQESCRCYPEAMFADDAALKAAAGDMDGEDAIYDSSILWEQKREEAARG